MNKSMKPKIGLLRSSTEEKATSGLLGNAVEEKTTSGLLGSSTEEKPKSGLLGNCSLEEFAPDMTEILRFQESNADQIEYEGENGENTFVTCIIDNEDQCYHTYNSFNPKTSKEIKNYLKKISDGGCQSEVNNYQGIKSDDKIFDVKKIIKNSSPKLNKTSSATECTSEENEGNTLCNSEPQLPVTKSQNITKNGDELPDILEPTETCVKSTETHRKFTETHRKSTETSKHSLQTKSVKRHDSMKKEHHLNFINTVTENNLMNSSSLTKGSEKVSKAVFARLALVKLWLILFLTIVFCVVLMVASHLTNSLTLRIEAYHALYNSLALGGCLLTMKICQGPQSLKNTFGWARVELMSCLCTLLFIASLCFSVTLESIQIAAHAGHQEPMHLPLPVIALSGIGLCLNAFVFCLIGGYTHHQGCFLERRGSDVWVQRKVPQEAVQAGMRTLSSFPFREIAESPLPRSYQGIKGILRDIAGLALTMLCAIIVYLNKDYDNFSIYIDPVFSVASASIFLMLSYPYGKECCQILLQTIPGNIDVQAFSAKLLQEIPEVINIHHLHIWSLTPGKVIATAHVVYSNPNVYRKSYYALEQFFLQKDITHVTLQPEFLHLSHLKHSSSENIGCLLRCTNTLCREKECCQWSAKHEDVGGSVCSEVQNEDSVTYTTSDQIQATEHDGSLCVANHGTSAYRSFTLKASQWKSEPTASLDDTETQSLDSVKDQPTKFQAIEKNKNRSDGCCSLNKVN